MADAPVHSPRIKKAFLLGAGLGNRLRPLTEILPKPLIPFYHAPLIQRSLDKCVEAGIEEVMINTHHLPEKWHDFFPSSEYKGMRLSFSHEPVLLDSGGGIKKIEEWINGEHILVCNADNVTDAPFSTVIAAHLSSDNLATLVLRNDGYNTNVAYDPATGRILDMRGALGVSPGSHQFIGIYCLSPDILSLIPADTVYSIITPFLSLIPEGKIGGIEYNDGFWIDLGSVEQYFKAYQQVPGQKIHPDAIIHPSAQCDEHCVIGPRAHIMENCILKNCIIWNDVTIHPGTVATEHIFYYLS